ncbi:MAG TPA: PQQ-dependent sugar dehydrogenase, partial [Humisphaera sp.]
MGSVQPRPALATVESLEGRTLMTVTSGFAQSVAIDGLKRPTAIALTRNRDSDVFVAEQAGNIRLVRGGDSLVTQPMATLPVDATGDRGLLGIVLDPNFTRLKYVYVNYTTGGSNPHQRISRLIAAGDQIYLNTEQVLLDLPSWEGATENLGGGLAFTTDGTLYVGVGVGDLKNKARAADPASPFGKVLRINPDGSVPANNPFAGADGWQKYVWAYGLKDPAHFSVH